MAATLPPETDPSAPRSPSSSLPPPPAWTGAVTGLLAASVATVVGAVSAAMLGVVGPLDAVGSGFIDRTPAWLKDFAIDLFGTNDKLALRIGTLVVIGIVGGVLGVLSLRRPWIGVAGIAAFGVVALFAVIERPAEPMAAVLPPLVAIGAGVAVLWLLLASAARFWQETMIPGRSMSQEASARRRFLRTAGTVAAAAAVVGTAVPLLERRRLAAIGAPAPDQLPPVDGGLPSTDFGDLDEVVGVSPFVTANADFYRIDTALRFPTINIDDWNVRIHGMVDHEIVLSYDQLLA